ncbi:hypothetical protein A2U01_0057331, partial [Trifolium medium]|nr:hypothetical protein [Trifolium medium]
MEVGDEETMSNEAIQEYRIEAERLFNIGTNLDVSSNAERIMMIEKFVELEKKDVKNMEDLEEEE